MTCRSCSSAARLVLLHGIPRLTEDRDITLSVSPDALARVIEACGQAVTSDLRLVRLSIRFQLNIIFTYEC